MKSNIYDFTDYKEILKTEINANQDQRGYQSQLAKAAECQTSFFSQVLNGSTHLTPDQASGIADFWKLDTLAMEYFITTVNLGRASKKHYHIFLQNKLKLLKEEYETITNRLKTAEINTEFETNYYSVWFRGVIHMILTIPEFQTAESIAKRLNLPLGIIQSEIINLQQMGLVEFNEKSKRWSVTKKQIHLNPESPLSCINLSNWRQLSSMRVFIKDPQAHHFSGVYTMSLKETHKIRNKIIDFLAEVKEIVDPSPEEEIVYLGIDFFKV